MFAFLWASLALAADAAPASLEVVVEQPADHWAIERWERQNAKAQRRWERATAKGADLPAPVPAPRPTRIPVSGAMVTLETGATVSCVTRRHGDCVLTAAREETRWDVMIRKNEYASLELVGVEVAPGALRTQRVEVRPMSSVTAEVIDP